MTATEKTLVSLADIAQLAGVTRAAVSNWRRRYTDFPSRTAGTAAAPLFLLSQVHDWLRLTGREREVSDEVALWHELRSWRPDDLVSGIAAVGQELREPGTGSLNRAATALVHRLAEDRGPTEVLSGLVARYAGSVGRGSGENVSTQLLITAVVQLSGDRIGSIYDPACGQGDLLLAVGDHKTERYGQDLRPSAVELTTARAALARTTLAVEAGDSLRDDRFPDVRAQVVVCDPPRTLTEWGREDLLVDTRWEFGLPPKSEGELAWLQHCFAHTAAGGRTFVALPAAVAYRRSGRRIRAEMVRRGCVEAVIQLPAGTTSGSGVPVHLWVLCRTPSAEGVRMLELSGDHYDLAAAWEGAITVPQVTLLDDEVDLNPARYVVSDGGDIGDEYTEARTEFGRLLRELSDSLPALEEATGWDRSMALDIGELIRHGLVSVDGDALTSHSEQIDADFLTAFVRSASNARRSTSSSGSFRVDPRASRVPPLDPVTQRAYGAIFRRLGAVADAADRLSTVARRASALAHEGLTSGSLRPVSHEETR